VSTCALDAQVNMTISLIKNKSSKLKEIYNSHFLLFEISTMSVYLFYGTTCPAYCGTGHIQI
jgi:hypothetical protein